MPVCFCTGNSTLSRNVTNRKYYKKQRKPRRRATARREPRCSYTATIGTAFHIQHRRIQKQANTVTHPHNQEIFKKSPRGVQRGRGFTAPLRFSTASQSKKTMPSAKKSKTYITSAQRETSNTEEYKNKPTRSHIPTTKKFSKKARGVCRGAVALRPLCGFPQLPKARKPCLLPRKAKHTSHRHNVKHPTPKNTKTSQHGHTSPQPRNFQKKPEGCAEGPWLYGPFAVFLSFSKPKTQAPCQGSKTYITK